MSWNPARYAAATPYVAKMGVEVVDVLAPQPGDRILDLGCGDGILTEAIATRGADVLGVDADPAMVEAARARGLNVELADARALPFDSAFDGVFSHAALHWVHGHAPILAGVYRALKPGGRFVAEFGARGNVGAVLAAIRGALQRRGVPSDTPFYFPTPGAYRALLDAAGFDVIALAALHRPAPLGDAGIRGWLEVLGAPMLNRLDAAQRAEAVDEIEAVLAPILQDEHGGWWVDPIRLRIVARKDANL